MTILRNLILFILFLCGATAITGCSRKLASASSDQASLEYRFTGNDSYSYIQSSKAIQTVVFGGQEASTSINSKMGFTASGKGIVNGSLMIEITVDTMGVAINSMGTNVQEDISSIKGKSFMLTMDTRGKDKNLDEAESLTYSLAGLQTSNMKASFINIFPGLPEENIHIGYSWQDTDTVNINTETENAEIIITSNNTVEAREKISGYDCYKIVYRVRGTRDGSSNTPQGFFISNADV
ncbi:MAG TPA: hypothetical protein ENN86_02110, partial [Desulfobacteraceae bacterium]|nr:hypothetical protein [Desulfobacteraceae bacterium]